MTIAEALATLEALQPSQIVLGLSRMETVLARLGHPEKAYPVLHVAGTNGKGSTCAMAAAGLRAAGLSTGFYSSPHLAAFQERIQVDGQPIPDADLIAGIDQVRAAAAQEPALSLTYFEFGTALAFVHFREKRVQAAVLETGLGGRLDATNVVHPVATAITPLGLDHTEILGPTLTDIAHEKAGVLKPGVPCALAHPAPEALRVIRARAEAMGALIYLEGEDFELSEGHYQGRRWSLEGVRVALLGPHQIQNAALALALLELAGEKLPISAEAARTGVASARWPGRLEPFALRGGATALLDGAHNPDAARALARAVRELFPAKPIRLVFGVLSDKDLEPMLATLFPLARMAWICAPKNARARAPESYREAAAALCPQVTAVGTVAEALKLACAGAGPEEIVLVCGSLYVVAEARALLLTGAAES